MNARPAIVCASWASTCCRTHDCRSDDPNDIAAEAVKPCRSSTAAKARLRSADTLVPCRPVGIFFAASNSGSARTLRLRARNSARQALYTFRPESNLVSICDCCPGVGRRHTDTT